VIDRPVMLNKDGKPVVVGSMSRTSGWTVKDKVKKEDYRKKRAKQCLKF